MNDVKDLIADAREVLGNQQAWVEDRDALAFTIENVRAWGDENRYKISGRHDTWDEYHEGIQEAQGEVLNILDGTPADLLREHDANVIHVWTARVRTELDATAIGGINLGRDYLEGVYSALQQADDHAARLLNDIPYRVKPEDER